MARGKAMAMARSKLLGVFMKRVTCSCRATLASALRVAKNFHLSDGQPPSIDMVKRHLILSIVIGLAFPVIGLPNAKAEKAGKPEKQQDGAEEDDGYSQISIFAKAVQLLRQDYVDGNKTSYHDLFNAPMKGMLCSLDPHSQYMDPNASRDMQDDTRSRFNGLGIEVSMKNGLPTVVTPMEDTPAARAGILSGDQILKINGTSTERMELQDAINLLRGAPGQKVTLTLLRPATKEIKEYNLERAEIKVQSVKGAKLPTPAHNVSL